MQQLKLKKGERCRVRRKQQGRRKHLWVDGHIKETSGRGAFVETFDGKSNFYRWTEIAFPKEPAGGPQKSPAPLATIGDAVKATQPQPPQPTPLPVTPAEKAALDPKRGWALLTSRPNLSLVTSVQRETRTHLATSIGMALRAERLKRGMTQESVARQLGISNRKVSKYELGDALPTEDELILFGVLFDTEFDIETGIRTTSEVPSSAELGRIPDLEPGRPVSKPASMPVSEPAPEPAPVPEPAPEPAPAEQSKPSTDRTLLSMYLEFVENVKILAPMPEPGARRDAWSKAVEELFNLTVG